jgi:hypothetical protein
MRYYSSYVSSLIAVDANDAGEVSLCCVSDVIDDDDVPSSFEHDFDT